MTISYQCSSQIWAMLYLSEDPCKCSLLEDPGLAVADRRLGQAVLDTLEGALQASDDTAPARYLEAGSRLGPDSLALAMDRALVARRPSAPMTREEFLEKAAALFIAKVKPVG